jgi:hypothetical protein
VLLIAAFALVPLAWACGGGDDDETVRVGDDEVTAGEDLPDGWPDDFPVYDGADLQGGIRGDVDGSEGLIATWETDDDASDVVAFYTGELEDGPWKSVSTTSGGDGTIIVFESTGTDQGGSVLIGEDEDKTTIFVTIGDAFDGDGSDDDSDDSGDDSSDGSGDAGDSGTGGDTPTEDDLPSEVDLPENYPSDRVPLPDGARVTTGTSSTVNGIGSHTLQFYSADSVEEVEAHFKSELEGNGFSEAVRTEQAGGVFVSYAENEDGSGMVVILTITDSEVPGYTSTVVQVTDTP